MKKLIVPVFGLFLAACTSQLAPSASEDSRLLNTESSGETATAAASIELPTSADDGFGPGAPGGDMGGGPPVPDAGDDGSGGSLPDFPDLPAGGG